MRIDRRNFLTGLGLAGVAAVLPGCANPANRPTSGGAAPQSPSTGASFPIEVEHRYGRTTISAAPRKIVAFGQTDLDPVVALRFRPIAVGSFVDSSYTPVRPWNAEHFPTVPGKLNMLEPEFEKIAALQPDLILAVMSGLTKADYAKFSAIAPTVAQHREYGDWAIPYRPHTELIGAALGKPAEAAALVDDLDQRFAAVRAANPTLAGKTAACAELWGADFAVLGDSAPRTHFLTDIGMTLSPELTKLVGKEYNAPLGAEKLDLLDDLDVLVWTTEHTDTAKLIGHKLVAPMRTTREGRYVLAANGGTDDLLYSMDWGTVLSNRWAIEHAVPRFVQAVDGNPATDANA